jgi:dephospho-CoA kinase
MGEIKPHKNRFIIGLTGNIGTGKSIVRKMLQHLGAYGIDADVLTHETLKPDGPAQERILNCFGASILDTHGVVDRAKLAHIVFSDEKALVELENILHPLISIAIANMIQYARLPIIIIEAIKLLESDLAGMCDSIWVVDAQEQVIFDRLSNARGMGHAEIKERLSHQSPSKNKKQRADMVIENSQEVYKTWLQVAKAWGQMKQKNRNFPVCINRTSDLLAFSKDSLITPSSDDFSAIEENIYKENQPANHIKWLGDGLNYHPPRQNHMWQDFTRLVCQHFLFADPNSSNNKNITIWDLSQFELALLGHNYANSDLAGNDFKKAVVQIEQFGHMHMTQRIIFPIEGFLKESKSFLREHGYKNMPSRKIDISYWNKAGYNLYQKKLCAAFDLFSKRI